jgi:cation:H+ antiporter
LQPSADAVQLRDVLVHILLLLVGLALLVKGGELFVAAAVRLAEFLRMPRVVIGSTLVSLATTTPELVVSIMAGAKGAPGLAVGNAIGSCICNVGLILGLTAAFKHIDVNPSALRTPLIAMFLFGAALLLLTLDLSLSPLEGAVLFAGGVAYFIYDFVKHARDIKPAHVAEAAVIQTAAVSRLEWFRGRPGTIIQFLLGAGVVVLGSRVLVDAAVSLASALGIPSIIIGLTIVAVGTSLPELITAVTSSRQAVSDLAVGNVLGANIANLTIIVGTAAMLSEVTMRRLTHSFNFPAMLAMFGLLLWMLLTGKRVTRKEGVTLLVTYIVYIAALVLLSAALKQ